MPAPTRPLRILIVDDHSDAVTAICTLLRVMGHECRGLERGTGVLAAIEEFDPALVFLDIALPDISGYEIAREVRARERPAPYLVAITGWGSPADRARALESGFDEHLLKPLDLVAVRNVLANVAAARGADPSS